MQGGLGPPESISLCRCTYRNMSHALCLTKLIHLFFSSLPTLPFPSRVAKRGGQKEQFALGPHCEGYYKCVTRGGQFLICPRSQKDSRQPCFPLPPSLSSPLSSLLSIPILPSLFLLPAMFHVHKGNVDQEGSKNSTNNAQLIEADHHTSSSLYNTVGTHAYNTMCNTHLHRTTV